MAKDGGMGNIVLLGGLAVGGYFLYQYMTAGSLPADAVFQEALPAGQPVQVPSSFNPMVTSQPPAGPATTQPVYVYQSPSTKLIYLSYTAPTAAQQAASLPFNAANASMSATPVTATVNTSSGPVTSPTGTAAAAAPAQSLDSVYTQLKTAGAAAGFSGSGDSLSASPDQWNYFLNSLFPSNSANLDALFPAPNRFSPVTAAKFWSAVGPVLGKQFGLSGLGLFAGLGDYLHERGVFPHGWA
jgi:hypothetical protein